MLWDINFVLLRDCPPTHSLDREIILNFLTYCNYNESINSFRVSYMLWNLVSLRSEHLASKADRMSYKVILIFLDLLVQTSRRSAAVKKTADISWDSDRLGNCRRRSLSADIAGSIFLRVEMRAWPVPALYMQVRSACCPRARVVTQCAERGGCWSYLVKTISDW